MFTISQTKLPCAVGATTVANACPNLRYELDDSFNKLSYFIPCTHFIN